MPTIPIQCPTAGFTHIAIRKVSVALDECESTNWCIGTEWLRDDTGQLLRIQYCGPAGHIEDVFGEEAYKSLGKGDNDWVDVYVEVEEVDADETLKTLGETCSTTLLLSITAGVVMREDVQAVLSYSSG